LLGLAFMMGVVLTVVFPSGREFAELTGKQRVDAYSLAYLTVLTRAKRDDPNLRLVQARQLGEIGRWDEALAALEGVTFDRATADAASSLRLELILARARALPSGSIERATAFESVRQEIHHASRRTWPAPRAYELGRLALELEEPALGARYFAAAGASETEPSARAAALAEAGRWLRAAGDERAASESFRGAAETTNELAEKLQYTLAAADALEAMARPCEAADLVRPYALGSDDVELVVRAAALSTSCGNARDAQLLGRRVLQLAPDDEAHVRAQVTRELGAGDPRSALALLKKLVKQHPGDSALRLMTARVAEWSGDPQSALEQWMFLVAHGHVPRTGAL
jgi:hypothetical protein